MNHPMTDPKQDVRQQFEAAFADCNLRRTSDRSDCYESTSTAALWEGYQAALQSPAVRELVEAAKEFAPAVPLTKRELRLSAALRTLGAGHVE